MKRLALFLLGVVLAWPAVAATKYIAQGGTAAWAACEVVNSPCSTSTASTNAAAGDVLCFTGTMTSGLNTATAGSPGSPIWIRGDCPGITAGRSANTGSTFSFITIDQPYWKVSGFTFGSMNTGQDSRSQLDIAVGGDNAVITGNTFDGGNTSASAGYFGILINVNNGTASDITNPEIASNTFKDYGHDAIRIVPRNATGGCAGGIKATAGVNIHDNVFRNVKKAVRAAVVYAAAADITSCLDGRPKGFLFDDNTVDLTIENALNFECQAGYLCRVSGNWMSQNGTGSFNAYNAIQTGKADGAIIEDNKIFGVRNNTSNQDGNAIIADHAGVYRSDGATTLQSQGIIIRRNYIRGADSNPEACGIQVWSADDTKVYSNVIVNARNGLCMTGDGVAGTSIDDNTGTEFVGNTVINPTDEGFEISRQALAHTFYNNVLYGGQWAVNIESGVAPTDGFNSYYGWTTAEVGGAGSYTPAGTNLTSNPDLRMTNTGTAADYKPDCTDSPLVRAGIDVGVGADHGNRRFNPGKPTIGAWECASGDIAPAATRSVVE
jgi:hypothetical protein